MSRTLLVASIATVLAGLTAFARAPQQAGAPRQQPPAPQTAPTPTWIITLDLGAKWESAKLPAQQAGFEEHKAGVGKLAAEGTLLVGGPLLDNFEAHNVTGAVWIVKAESQEAAKKLLAVDPWVRNDLMKVGAVRAFYAAGGSWLGGAKPAAPPPPPAK